MNIELLLEDITFPLSYDDMSYIWDAKGHMVAMSASNDQAMYEAVRKLNAFAANGFHFDNSGYTYTKRQDTGILKNGEPLLLIRGWGRLQYKQHAIKRQDNIVDFFLTALNANLSPNHEATP